MNDRVLSLLSLATKAGKTAGGEALVEKAVKQGKASLVIISSEASDSYLYLWDKRGIRAFYRQGISCFGGCSWQRIL